MKHEKYPSIHLISSTYQRSGILIKEFAERKKTWILYYLLGRPHLEWQHHRGRADSVR